MADRLSQEAVEVLQQAAAKARLSQEAVEVLEKGNPNALLSQLAVEALYLPPAGKNHLSQIALEVLFSPSSFVPRNPAINHQNPAVV